MWSNPGYVEIDDGDDGDNDDDDDDGGDGDGDYVDSVSLNQDVSNIKHLICGTCFFEMDNLASSEEITFTFCTTTTEKMIAKFYMKQQFYVHQTL